MYVRAVVNAIVDRSKGILLVKRKERPGDLWAGDVALPGGLISPGENIITAGLRETLEETNIDPEDLHVFGVVGLEYPRNAPWLKTAVLLSKPRGRIVPSPGGEVDEVLWFNPRRVDGLKLLYKNDKLVIGYYLNGKIVWGMTWRIIRKLLFKGII